MTDSSNSMVLLAQLIDGQFDVLDTFAPQNELEQEICRLGSQLRETKRLILSRESYLEQILGVMMQLAEGHFPEAFLLDFMNDTEDKDELINAIMVTLYMMAEELSAARQNLVDAHDKAVKANETKSMFLANMSHELRTPLNAIIGYTELIHEDAMDAGAQEVVDDADKILIAARHLLSLISDILDVSKIEAGKMDLFLETISIKELIHEILTTLEPLARAQGNTLLREVDDNLGMMVVDQTKMRQILINIMSNAIKFTHEGRVRFQATSELINEAPHIKFVIEDTGIGIAPERIKAIFEPFIQADGSTTREFGGTGLGLAISSHFINMMKGHIHVDSVIGEGSTFTLTFPINEDAKAQRPITKRVKSAPHDAVKVTHILIVDDDPSVHDIARRASKDHIIRCTSVYNGADALRYFAEHPPPDLVLLDMFLPDMDGRNVLAKIKTSPELKHIPVIMISVADDRTMAFALGATDYLVKPVNFDGLFSAISRFLQEEDVSTILIAEDDPSSRELFDRMLSNRGYSVHAVENGQEALTYLEEHSAPDMILLDINMPEVDGFGVMKRLNETPQWAAIPVVILTAMDLTQGDFERLGRTKADVLTKATTTTDHLFLKIFSMISATDEEA